MKKTPNRTWIMITIIMYIITSSAAYAQSYKEVTMTVGETETFYLPSSVTSKDLKSITFYSNGISYVQVTSYTAYSVTVKALKAFSSPIVVRCDYRYYVRNESYIYEASGVYDFRITVVDGNNDGRSSVEPTSIRFSSSAVGVSVGETRQLTPTVLPVNAEYTLTWSINDNKVATISQDGLLVGKSEGAADLKVKTQNGVYAMLRVVVSRPTPTSVSITPSTLTITEGDSKYLSVKVYPSTANQSVTWSSDNPGVATVSAIGQVTAIKAGTATITARTSNGKTGTCTVICNSAIPNIVLSDMNGNSNLPSLADVQYERTLYQGWNSLCVPFEITRTMFDLLATGCKIATAVEVEIIGDRHVLSVKEVETVFAGQACLIYVPKDIECKFNLSNVSLKSNPDDTSVLKGSYQRTVIGPNLYKLNDDGTSFGITHSHDAIVGPYRAYVKLELTTKTRAICDPIEIELIQIKH